MAVAGKQEELDVVPLGAGVVGPAGAGPAAQAVARTPLAREIDGLVYIVYVGK